MPDRKDQRAEAERDTDATEFEPDLQYGVMRVEREGLARQGNAIRPISLVAMVDYYLRRAAGEPPCRVEPPADDRALPDVLGNKAPDFEPVRR